MFRIAFVFIFIAIVESRNGLFSQLQETRNTMKNLEVRKENSIQDTEGFLATTQWIKEQVECDTCISALNQVIQKDDKLCNCAKAEATEINTCTDDYKWDLLPDQYSFVADKLIQSLSIQRVLEINKLQKDLGSMHNELCEVIDCGYPAAQMLCEHCIDQVQECEGDFALACSSENKCIDDEMVCNGKKDCKEEEDEWACSETIINSE